MPAKTAFRCEVPALKAEFEVFHKRLVNHISCVDEADFLLLLRPEGLELREIDGATKPLRIDFATMLNRRKTPKIEAVARAVGCKGEVRPKVLDLTAGLAQDAFVLASYGCQVDMLERSPIIAVLLEDGLKRAQTQAKLAPIVGRISLQNIESKDFLSSAVFSAHDYDALYIDPMYPETGKSAAKRKEMRFFRALVGSDNDADQLLELALQTQVRRVVVKRPLKVPPLTAKPSASIKGKTTRFDLYLC